MIARLLDAFFRHKWLIIPPPVLVPLISLPAIMLWVFTYETRAAIWIERPTYLRQAGEDLGRFVTPAQTQAARLNELLRSRTFLMDVADQTPLSPLIGTTRGEDRIEALVEKGLTIAASGNNLVVVRFEASTPEISYQFVNALVEQFRERADAGRRGQADHAISFYEARVQAAEEQLAKSNEAVRRYVGSNPRLSMVDRSPQVSASGAARPAEGSLAALDPKLAELRARVELDERDVERARQSLDEAQLSVSASLQGQELGFQIIDPPRVPTEPKRSLKKIATYLVAAEVAGLSLSAALLLLLIVTDRSVRSEPDLVSTYPVIGAIPRLEFDSLVRISDVERGTLAEAGSDATRRAFGSSAAMLLPAPQRSVTRGSST